MHETSSMRLSSEAPDLSKSQSSLTVVSHRLRHHLSSSSLTITVMSFGWSVGDILGAISVITKISKGLKDSGGAASSYQQNVDFLDSVSTTLKGVSTVISKNAHLAWEDALTAQATRLKNAIDAFVFKAKKFEKSLASDSDRGKLKQAPRKVQWTLFADEVEKLKTDVERTMSVMNDLILLQSL